MRTSAPGISSRPARVSGHRCPPRGFTLLELVVVVFIIGIAAGAAMLSLAGQGRERQVAGEGRRLQRTLELAANEAVLRGRVTGVAFAADGYAYCVRERGAWRVLEGDPLLARHALPDGLRLTWRADGDGRARGDGDCPHVSFLPSGELDPFRVELRVPGGGTGVVVDGRDGGIFGLAPLP